MPQDKKQARRAVRVEDVAREAGVSPITVSRALSSPEKVKEETRRKVEAAVARTGYVLNRFASTLRSGHSTLIPVFIPTLRSPHIARAVQGCMDALEGSRYHLLMAPTGASEELQADMLAEVLPFRPAALVFNGTVRSEPMRAQLRALDIPVLEMWEVTDEPLDMMVGLCNREAGQLLGRHFRERGFAKVAFAGRVADDNDPRLAGFAEAFGRPFDHVVDVETERELQPGMGAFTAIMAALPDCDAIAFGSDLLAVGGMLQAAKADIKVPDDVAVVGYGDLEFSPHISPPLTSIHIPAYDMGCQAGKMLLRRLAGAELESRTVVSPLRLEVRDSTRR